MKTKLVLWLGAVSLGLGHAPAQSQDPPSSEVITGPQLAEMFNAAINDPEFAAVIGQISDELLVTSEVEEGWSTRGIYLPDWLAEREAEMGPVVLHENDGQTVTVQYVNIQPPQFPKGYRTLTLRKGAGGDQTEGAVIGFAPGIWLAGEAPFVRKGNALCSSINALSMRLYTNRRLEDWSETDFATAMVFYSGLSALGKVDVCSVYYEQDDGTLTSQAFTRTGEPYINMNAQPDRLEAIPADKAASLISSAKLTNPFES